MTSIDFSNPYRRYGSIVPSIRLWKSWEVFRLCQLVAASKISSGLDVIWNDSLAASTKVCFRSLLYILCVLYSLLLPFTSPSTSDLIHPASMQTCIYPDVVSSIDRPLAKSPPDVPQKVWDTPRGCTGALLKTAARRKSGAWPHILFQSHLSGST